MWVTIYTDASHLPNTKKATYAFWMRWQYGRVIKSGKFKDDIADSFRAEIRCILNAIYTAKKQVSNLQGIYLITDCKPAINLLRDRNNKPETLLKFAPEIVVYDAITKGLTIKFKHTKAHLGGKNIQSYINEQCDKLAKKAYQ